MVSYPKSSAVEKSHSGLNHFQKKKKKKTPPLIHVHSHNRRWFERSGSKKEKKEGCWLVVEFDALWCEVDGSAAVCTYFVIRISLPTSPHWIEVYAAAELEQAVL